MYLSDRYLCSLHYPTWLQATEYAECLSALEEEKAAGRSYRLPTEAEWEYACRAGTTTDFAFGSVLLPSEANFSENGSQASAQQTCPVGSFQPNDWGFYDMHGNVWEWCSDWFDDEYYGNSPADDPGGPEDGSHHTLRGGAASNAGYECSSYSRGEASSCDGPIDSSPAWGRYEALGDFGIRLVCEINLGEDGHDDEDDDESLGGDGNGETGGVQERFFRIVSDQVSVAKDKLTLETSFGSDLGADSLDLVELVMEVEEEFGIHAFRWLIANDAFDIIQPDQFYFGGLIRSMQVTRMAEAGGKTIVPHLSAGGLGYLYLLHYVSVCPNAGEYHEFKLFATRDANGTTVPIESKTEPFVSVDGVIKVPTGSGLGVRIDPDYIKTHKVIYG